MPEHLKPLIVIMGLAIPVFWLARSPMVDAALSLPADYARRRNLWFAITLVAFVFPSFWLYAFVASGLLIVTRREEPNALAMYFVLLLAVPSFSAEIPGFGLVRYLFALNHGRLLALCLLLPAAIYLMRRNDSEPVGKHWADRLLLGYLALNVGLQLRDDTLTNTLRSAFVLGLDVWLPYYVASRSLRGIPQFRDAMAAWVLTALVSAAIAVFEFSRHWLLYAALDDRLGIHWGLGHYLARGASLRAVAATGQPIVLGLVMVVGLGFLLFLNSSIRQRSLWWLGMALLIAGLLASVSRGPWVGAVVTALVYVAAGPLGAMRVAMAGVAFGVLLPVLLMVPALSKFVDYLPFVGTVEAENVDYRQRLFQISMDVIAQKPWFGSSNYLEAPEMQALIQGQGIIDIVNSYIGVALRSGFVGLALFVGVFVLVLATLVKLLRRHQADDDPAHHLARALLATLAGVLVTIATTSSISIIPLLYWSLAGMAVACGSLAANRRTAI